MRDLMIPVLIGEVSKNGNTIKVWCPYCRKTHIHGYLLNEQSPHRASHCSNENSPFIQTGYFIKPLSYSVKK